MANRGEGQSRSTLPDPRECSALITDEEFIKDVKKFYEKKVQGLWTQHFAKWLEDQCNNANLTGKELAERLGVDPGAVSRWRGGSGMNISHAIMLLAEFNCDFNSLKNLAPKVILLEASISTIKYIKS